MTVRLSLVGSIGAVLLSAGMAIAQVVPATQPQPQGAVAPCPIRVGGIMDRFSAVKGLPYSLAETRTTVKASTDGTTTTTEVRALRSRDAEGRTRIETGRMVDGVFEPDRVTITDPEARFQAHLKIATLTGDVTYGPAPKVRTPEEEAALTKRRADAAEARKAKELNAPDFQQLGHKTLAGVDAEGSRWTAVIPACTQGNATEIRVATEVWYYAELDLNLASTRDDPRSGKTTLVVTDLQRSEPDASLFKIPEGYTTTVHGKP